MTNSRLPFAFLLSGLILAACSDSGRAPGNAPASPQPRGPSAEQQFVLYQQMLEADNAELALPLGDEILRTFPDSPQAAKVREDIETLRAKATNEVETRRLSRLWSYQVAPMAGGQQSTASIHASNAPPPGEERVRLVLRRHTEWGQSVFLYGNEPGFSCAKACRVEVKFDDEPARSTLASIPPTGEPAIFIEDDKAFIAKVAKSRTVSIQVQPKLGDKRTLLFEVGGYDADKFVPAPKKP